MSSYIYITLHTAERGVSDAQYKLGCYLLSGGEGEADAADKGAAVVLRRESTEEALRWIRMAADGGHADAGESVAFSPQATSVLGLNLLVYQALIY